MTEQDELGELGVRQRSRGRDRETNLYATRSDAELMGECKALLLAGGGIVLERFFENRNLARAEVLADLEGVRALFFLPARGKGDGTYASLDIFSALDKHERRRGDRLKRRVG